MFPSRKGLAREEYVKRIVLVHRRGAVCSFSDTSTNLLKFAFERHNHKKYIIDLVLLIR
jgi:hypothetical protein